MTIKPKSKGIIDVNKSSKAKLEAASQGCYLKSAPKERQKILKSTYEDVELFREVVGCMSATLLEMIFFTIIFQGFC